MSFHKALEELGHEVLPCGEGHAQKDIKEMAKVLVNQYDLFIDLDCGRNGKGELHFQNKEGDVPIPSAAWFIDSHNHHYASLHHRISKHYNHIFFAVWDRRDRFAKHPSTHWAPNATDSYWFDKGIYNSITVWPKFEVGFFGSKGGLDRADMLRTVCTRRSLKHDIREIGRTYKVRWPRTAEAMYNCKYLFNKSQKHDGPNQRVMESMIMGRPLITDRDPRSGMSKLFEEGTHYLGYTNESELGNQIDWLNHSENQPIVANIVKSAYEEVKKNHQVKNRVEQIMEVCFK